MLGAVLGAIPFFPGTVPGGVYGRGIVFGAFYALHAFGVVLVYRSNRVVNFAQVQVGVVAAALFAMLVQYRPLLRGYSAVCPGCSVTPAIIEVNYWVSLVLSMASAVLLGYAIYFLVIKRFAKAPRLVLTLATIFLAQLLGAVQGALPSLLSTEEQRARDVDLVAPQLPFVWKPSWDPVIFDASEVLLVLVAALAVIGLTVYLRLTRMGTAVRAAGESPMRAETMGIRVTSLHGRVWAMAAALSGAAGLLLAMTSPPLGQASLDVTTTMHILAVAVIARMVSLPLAAAAAMVFGILFHSVVWSYGTAVMFDSIVLGVVVVVLVVQNCHNPRELEQASAWRAAREVRPVPKELRSLPVVRYWLGCGRAMALLTVLALPWVLTPSQAGLATVAVIYAIAGLSLLVVTGWVGHISLGQFAFAAVGAYVVAALRLPFILALPAGAVAGAVAAVIVGVPALRLQGLHLALITLGFALSVPVLLLNSSYLGRVLPDSLQRPAFLRLDLDDSRTYYYVCMSLLGLGAAAVVGLRRSRTGRVLIAGRDNEAAARSFGIDLVRARMGAYAVSGALAGLAGALFAFHQHAVRPGSFLAEVSVTVFTMAVIGGLGSVSGPLIGAVYVGSLLVFSASPTLSFLATGGGGLALLLFLPGGIGQLAFGLRDSLLRRVAYRHGISVPSLATDRSAGRHSRAPITPRARPSGSEVFVPARYRLDGQWHSTKV